MAALDCTLAAEHQNGNGIMNQIGWKWDDVSSVSLIHDIKHIWIEPDKYQAAFLFY